MAENPDVFKSPLIPELSFLFEIPAASSLLLLYWSLTLCKISTKKLMSGLRDIYRQTDTHTDAPTTKVITKETVKWRVWKSLSKDPINALITIYEKSNLLSKDFLHWFLSEAILIYKTQKWLIQYRYLY